MCLRLFPLTDVEQIRLSEITTSERLLPGATVYGILECTRRKRREMVHITEQVDRIMCNASKVQMSVASYLPANHGTIYGNDNRGVCRRYQPVAETLAPRSPKSPTTDRTGEGQVQTRT